MINIDIYYIASYLKKVQVFIILLKDLQYQIEKEVKPETNSKIFIIVYLTKSF